MDKELEANTTLSHYRIEQKIGAGGMGEVWLAKDTRLKRKVALKMLPADFAADEDRVRRFEQEARATSALNHPNILTVYDIGNHEGSPFIVAELLEGEELREHLENGALPVRKAIDYARQITAGLSAAREKGIVHRDLKPENIFVTKDERVKILDFGLAKLKPSKLAGGVDTEALTQKPLTDPGGVMGTVGYMSPEQVRGQGGEPKPVNMKTEDSDVKHRFPYFLPDGRHFLFLRRGGIWAGSLEPRRSRFSKLEHWR